MEPQTISKAHLQQDDEDNYWLHVQSSEGPASLNLSTMLPEGSISRRNVEAWAKEQLADGSKQD
jgi:hypothetical protein